MYKDELLTLERQLLPKRIAFLKAYKEKESRIKMPTDLINI